MAGTSVWSATSLLLLLSPLHVFADSFSHGQIPLYDSAIDVSGRKYYGMSTYANLPYVHCLSAEKVGEVEEYDIAILGAPFDTVSINSNVTGRNVRSDECGCSLLQAGLVQGLDQQVSDGDLRGYRMDGVFTRVC